ncbi:nucleolar protein 16-like [Littorina saxatilis]|uniref:Nucleolar protein 16 n=1 Tax=Littorina saxatilis TaxID=31220 RepID=A0AAN9BS23_9CAEN
MGKPKKRNKSYNYNTDRRKEWAKSKKMPTIHCKQIRQAWDEKKSMLSNLQEMGLSANPNKSIHIPTAKELLGPKEMTEDTGKKKGKQKKQKLHVVAELEAEAAIPEQRRLKLSEPDTAFCISMMERYGEDYKAMARDAENYYQDTPKQIARKIRVFRSIPEQYNAYLASKASSA